MAAEETDVVLVGAFAARAVFILLISELAILASSGCGIQTAPAAHESAKREQVLPLTLGGFLKDGPEAEKVDGVCGTDYTRNLLNCDVYNGLPGWTITEVTFVINWSPYENDDQRYYRVPVTIKSLTTEQITVRLGLQLPPDTVFKFRNGKAETFSYWHWQIVGAKGYP